MSTQKSFFDAVKERRTYYQLNKESPISDKQITDIAEKAILHVPSSFNSQSTRLVVLLNKDHEQFWDFVLEVCLTRKKSPCNRWNAVLNID
jgi:predicted oxidoreductase (fatty acid repression mutant protein)